MRMQDGSQGVHERILTIGGREIKLSRTEYRLLEALRSRPERAFTRAELVALVMSGSIVLERTIDVHVKTLRQKFGRWATMIQTVRGVGYRFAPPADDGAGGKAVADGNDGVFTTPSRGPQMD